MKIVEIKQEVSPESFDHKFTPPSGVPLRNFGDPSIPEEPSTSSSFIKSEDVKVEIKEEVMESSFTEDQDPEPGRSDQRLVSALKGAGDYKYGYEDIITGTFQEKLDECLSKGVTISMENEDINALNESIYENYQSKINTPEYKKFKKFRKILPTYKKSEELLKVFNENQVVVVSGETGCGKSTQVLILFICISYESPLDKSVEITLAFRVIPN